MVARLKMAETVREAVTFIEQGRKYNLLYNMITCICMKDNSVVIHG